MLISMTGFGEAVAQGDDSLAQVEVRSVNNRHLKSNCRLPEGYASVEPKIDSLIKNFVRRGTVYLTVQITRKTTIAENLINLDVLQTYYNQLKSFQSKVSSVEPIPLTGLLELPGVVNETNRRGFVDKDWPLIEAAVSNALKSLHQMRMDEGLAMATDLAENKKTIEKHLKLITERAPKVVEAYQNRLRERLVKMLKEFDVDVQPQDVLREVGVFADRADISEEIVRLRSHLDQFDIVLDGQESNGRKLEFLIQEMFRETNTIGSKANDSEVAQDVVEIKTIIERLREMVQNVE